MEIIFKHNVIYKTTNIINNKIYVGQHRTNNINDNYLGSGQLLVKAIKKHGKTNFKKDILVDLGEGYHNLNLLEIKFIKELNSMLPNGYNKHEGGGGLSKEKLLEMKEMLKGNQYGKNNKGKVRNLESRKRLSLAKKGIKTGKRNKEFGNKISMANKFYFLNKRKCYVFNIKNKTLVNFNSFLELSNYIKEDVDEIKKFLNHGIFKSQYIIVDKIETLDNFLKFNTKKNSVVYLYFVKNKSIEDISKILEVDIKFVYRALSVINDDLYNQYYEKFIKKIINNNRYYKSEEHKKKLSEALLGKLVGEKNPNFGHFWTKETKKKLSDKLLKSKHNKKENNPKAKKVILVDLVSEEKYYLNYIGEIKDRFPHIKNFCNLKGISGFKYYIYEANIEGKVEDIIKNFLPEKKLKFYELIKLYKNGEKNIKLLSIKTKIKPSYVNKFLHSINYENNKID